MPPKGRRMATSARALVGDGELCVGDLKMMEKWWKTDGKHGKTMKSMNKTQFYHRILIMFHLDTHVYDIFLSMGENIDGPIYIL
jgi:hypothetical protein